MGLTSDRLQSGAGLTAQRLSQTQASSGNQDSPASSVLGIPHNLNDSPLGILQRFVVKGLTEPIARLGVTGYNAVAGKPLDTSRNLPIYGQTEGYQPVTNEGGLISPAGKFQNPINPRGLAQSVGAGAELASLVSGGGEAANLAEQGLKTAGKGLVKEGAIIGGSGAFGAGLQDKNATAKSVALDTALGAGVGAVGGKATESLIGAVAKKAAGPTSEEAFKEALSISRPKMTSKLEQQAFNEGRIGKQNLFKGAEVAPSYRESRIAEAVQPLIQSGKLSEKMDPAVQRKAIDTEVAKINQGVKEMLNQSEYKFPQADRSSVNQKTSIADYYKPKSITFNKDQLSKKLNAAYADNRLVFAGDKAAENAYSAVMGKFKSFVKGKTIGDLFDARQEFDRMIKSKFPNVFKKDAFGMINPADNARKTALLDVRNAANNLIADLLPANNPYKAMLRNESSLLQAGENIGTKIKGITQTGKVQSFLNTPKGKLLKRVGSDLGIGGLGIGAYEGIKHLGE